MHFTYKSGEIEAKSILMGKGIIFDETYHDDNSKPCMPDLKLSTGRFLEVTHTKHNNKDWSNPNRFFQKTLGEKFKILIEAQNAYNRLIQDDYEKKENEEYTAKGKSERNRDNKIVKKHYGYDFDTHERSEFGCNAKGMSFLKNNILYEIIEDKGKKYPNGDVDLFIYILPEEYAAFMGEKEFFIEQVMKSPFKIIYLCIWDIFNQKYETGNPTLIKIDLECSSPSIKRM